MDTKIIALLCVAIIGLGYILATRKPSVSTSLDGEVIAQLKKAGSDITKVHNIDFFLYVPTEQSAHEIANKLETEGYSVKVKRGAQGKDWLAHATKNVVPTENTMIDLRNELSRLAESFGGEYDGWGAEVTNQ